MENINNYEGHVGSLAMSVCRSNVMYKEYIPGGVVNIRRGASLRF